MFSPVVLQFADRSGQSDNAVDRYQNGQYNDDRFGPEIFLHDDLLLSLPCLLLPSAGIRFETALRATCSLMLSGFTQYQGVVVDGHNGSDDAAAGEYHVSVLQFFEHLFLLLLLPLHRQKQQEIKDRKNEQNGNEAHQ